MFFTCLPARFGSIVTIEAIHYFPYKRCNRPNRINRNFSYDSCDWNDLHDYIEPGFTVQMVEVRLNGSNMLVKHYPTLLGGVGRCLISVGCWGVQTNPTPPNNVGFQYQVQNYGVFLIMRTKLLDDVEWKVWTKSNIVQHCPTYLIVLFKWVKHIVSNNTVFIRISALAWAVQRSVKFNPELSKNHGSNCFSQEKIIVLIQYCSDFPSKKLVNAKSTDQICLWKVGKKQWVKHLTLG